MVNAQSILFNLSKQQSPLCEPSLSSLSVPEIRASLLTLSKIDATVAVSEKEVAPSRCALRRVNELSDEHVRCTIDDDGYQNGVKMAIGQTEPHRERER